MVPHYTLKPGTYNPFWSPHIQTKGCHVGRDGYLQGLRDSQGGRLLCQYVSLSCRSGGFVFNLPRLLRGQLRYTGGRGLVTSLRRGGAEDMGKCDRAPLRSLFKPSASNPTTAISTFWRPLVSKYWASSHNRVAWHNKCSPWKRIKRDLSHRLSHEIIIEQLERSNYKRLNNAKQPGIPDSAAPVPPSPLGLAPSTSIQVQAQSTSYCSNVVTMGSSPSDYSSSNDRIPDEQKESG